MDGLKALNQLYNMYDKYKDTFRKSSVLPLYCLNHPEATFLVSCGLSNHKDKDGRDIYCLQGISVAHEYRRHFWFILPWILANYDGDNILNTWKNVDFSGADDIVRHISGDCFFKIDPLDESLAKLTQTPKPFSERLPVNESTSVSFDKNGLKELSHLIVSYHDCMDFAFGATPEMAKNFHFKVIAKLGVRSKRKNSTEMVTADSTPSLVSDDGLVKLNDEHFNDPVDRFDPRKKVDLNQAKIFRGNGSSRILGQFLPRFLSVFKVGRKLRQFRSSNRKDK